MPAQKSAARADRVIFARASPTRFPARHLGQTGSTVTDDNDMGLDFSNVTDDLAEESYPISKSELLDRYGDREIGIESGTRTLRELLEPVGQDEFDGQDSIHQTILTMVDKSAEGRERYSDRGLEFDQDDQVSF